MGDTSKAATSCGLCIKYQVYGCLVCCVSPCDACYNCIFYNLDNCKTGVTGFKDIVKHSLWLGKKIGNWLELKSSNEPETTFNSYAP
jgi:hypothetical protein